MYKELIRRLSAGFEYVAIQPPCPEAEIAHAEAVVGYPFPAELRALLRELNGDRWCVLSAQEIIENVGRNRRYYLPFFEEDFSKEAYLDRVDRFVFFATNGCGDYYCYHARTDDTVDDSVIYIWEHEEIGEECCWRPVANNMAEFLTKYYQNKI